MMRVINGQEITEKLFFYNTKIVIIRNSPNVSEEFSMLYIENTEFHGDIRNQCPIFLFSHPQYLASIIKSNFGPRWLNTLLIVKGGERRG